MSKRTILFLFLCVALVGCASSGPKTQYYSLFSSSALQPLADIAQGDTLSLGVGPVILPEFMDNPAVVSTSSAQQVIVSGNHAWAGDLEASVVRVLATDLSEILQTDNIFQFPWDTRTRPDYQLRIVFSRFNGERGGNVRLAANWVLIDTRTKDAVLVRSSRIQQPCNNDSVAAYVTALNTLLNLFAQNVAEDISQYWLANQS